MNIGGHEVPTRNELEGSPVERPIIVAGVDFVCWRCGCTYSLDPDTAAQVASGQMLLRCPHCRAIAEPEAST